MQECLLYTEPELYDLLFPNARSSTSVLDPIRQGRLLASEQFYLEEAAKGGPILELACGTGRLTVPIAQMPAVVRSPWKKQQITTLPPGFAT